MKDVCRYYSMPMAAGEVNHRRNDECLAALTADAGAPAHDVREFADRRQVRARAS